MKKNILIIMVLLFNCSTYAQNKKENKSALSVGGEAALPLVKKRNGHGVDFGGSLQQEFLLGKASITLNLGLVSAKHASSVIEHEAWLMAGTRYYFTKNLYAAGQLGPGVVKGNDFAAGAFVYSPGIGAKFKPLDVSLLFRGSVFGEPFSTIGVRVAVVF